MITGIVNSLLYLTLLNIGYSFFDYLNFIFTRVDCLIYFFGIIIIYLTLNEKGEKYDLHI